MFKTEDLIKIDKLAQDIINKRIEEADILSNEIKELESRLKILSLPKVFSYCFLIDSVSSLTEPPFTEHINKHCLVWGKDTYKSFRLMYTLHRSVEEDGEVKATRLVFTKPLSECVINVRLLTKNHLATFYEKVIEEYKKTI